MTASENKGRRWAELIRCTFGCALCLLAIGQTWAGLQWYWGLAVLCGGIVTILGRRRIIRVGVTRTSDWIVCRYVPWFEGNAYLLTIALPLIGVASIAAGFATGNPAWLRYSGLLLICLTPLLASGVVRMWRRSFLQISPSALAIQLAAPKDQPIGIPRECVQSIAPKVVPNGVGGTWLQVEIIYRAEDSDDELPKTVLLGLQLTVEPFNLLSALTAWKDFGGDTPTELLDRVEQALRDRSTTRGVSAPSKSHRRRGRSVYE